MSTDGRSGARVAVVTAGLLAIALAGCTGSTGDVEAFVLGSILPLTGDLGAYGPSAQRAVELAVQEVNAAGGVNGMDVVLRTADSETSETAASAAASQLVNVDRVHAIVGAMGSGISLSFIDQVVAAGIPMISPSNTAPSLTDYADGGWYFRTVPSDALQGQVMAKVVRDDGHDSASIIAINNDYGVGFGDVFKSSFEAAGASVAAYVKYDPQSFEGYGSDVQTAAAANPDVMIVIGYPDTVRVLAEDAYEDGYLGPDGQFDWFFSEGLKDQAGFVDQLPKPGGNSVLEGYKGTAPQPEQTPAADSFLSAYKAAHGEDPALFADRTYDAAMLLMLAAEKCDCVRGDGLKRALMDVQNAPGTGVSTFADGLAALEDGDDIDYDGAAGPMTWDDVGDVNAPYEVWQVVSGTIQVVEQNVTAG